MIDIACSLEVADRIDMTPRPAAELARECGADADKLTRLLRALAAFGLFAVSEDDLVSHTEDSRFLRKDSVPTLHYAARYYGMPSSWAVWGAAGRAITTGQAPFELEYGRSFFDHLAQDPEEAAIFDAFMQHSPDDRHAAVAEAYDFSQAGIVVDVGGGNGGAAGRRACRKPEAARHPARSGRRGLGRRRGAGQPRQTGCSIEAASFFEFIPAGGDVYTLSQILHDWNDERCAEILARCRAAIKPAGRLLIIERVLDRVPDKSNAMNFLADMHMMMLFPGARERTLPEFAALLRKAGFAEPTLIATRSAFSIVEARPA